MGSTSCEPRGAVMDAAPCSRRHRPAVPCPAGTGWPQGLLQPGIKALGTRMGAPELPVRQDPRSRGRAGVSQGLPCPAPALDLAGIWDAPGAEGAGTAVPRGAFPRHCRSGSASHSLPSLPWGSLVGFFLSANVCAALCGEGQAKPRGHGCRESSCSILTIPGHRWERDPLTGQEQRAEQSCLLLLQDVL